MIMRLSNHAILISTSAIICSHLQNRTQNSENTFTRTPKRTRNSTFWKIARRWSCNPAILILQSCNLDIKISTSAIISKTEPKTLKTPLQERLKNSKTQCFWRSHVDDPAIVQSCNPMRYITHQTRTDGQTDRDSHIFNLGPHCNSRTQ